MQNKFDFDEGIIKLFYKHKENFNEVENETQTRNVKELCDKAVEFYDNEEFEKAAECWMTAARLGDDHAEYCLAICFSKGLGVEANNAEAFKFFLSAAEKGNECAQYGLALCYEYGEGVKTDFG